MKRQHELEPVMIHSDTAAQGRSFFEHVMKRSRGKVPWLLDLTLWYAWHAEAHSLPTPWKNATQVEIARDLGSPAWLPVRPWKISLENVEKQIDEGEESRTIRYLTGSRTLTATWTLGPDGDWWQVEHLIKGPDDFVAAMELAESRRYVVHDEMLPNFDKVEDDVIIAIELPRRPLSELLHDFLGWGEGLLMLRDFEAEVDRLIQILDDKLQSLVGDLAPLPAHGFLSPDNLDGQYISPAMFDRYLGSSYQLSSTVSDRAEKWIIVHVGGPMKHLLGPLSASGIDVVEGVSGPPQSDAPLPAAREASGPGLTLWGGLPQDWFLEIISQEDFESSVGEVIGQAIGERNVVLGVADKVPKEANIERLQMLSSLLDNPEL